MKEGKYKVAASVKAATLLVTSGVSFVFDSDTNSIVFNDCASMIEIETGAKVTEIKK